jgi:Ca2+-binding RTX toxin-like protein
MKAKHWNGLAGGAVAALTVGALLIGPVAAASNPTVVMGTPKADHIAGMNGAQIIWGLGGNDVINGGRGPDILHGGPGDDVLTTGKGGATEAAFGGPGDDVLKDYSSGQSHGLLAGGEGHDVCIGDKHDTFRSCEVIEIRPHLE